MSLGRRALSLATILATILAAFAGPAEAQVAEFQKILDSYSKALDANDVETLVYCASMGFGHVPRLVRQLEERAVRRAIFISTTAIFTSLPLPAL